MDSPTMPPKSAIQRIEETCATRFEFISEAASRADRELRRLRRAVEEERLLQTDTSLIVFGSLARREWTTGSDLDWALLVDGQADEQHLTLSHEIRRHIRGLGHKAPGPEAVFAGPAFSHELIHRIGGEADSNQNTTRRLLLLLESRSAERHGEVRERVVRQLLKRYIEDDHGYRSHRNRMPYVPRFLLNDIARYWRTMAVDFAAKRRDREGAGWALRRFKLRMSRKLIYTAGLVMCLRCKSHPSEALRGELTSSDEFCCAMADQLFELVNTEPLELLAQTAIDYDAHEVGKSLLKAYDEFLGILSDDEKRGALRKLPSADAPGDALFDQSDRIGRDFQEALSHLLFDTRDSLTRLAQRYGVF